MTDVAPSISPTADADAAVGSGHGAAGSGRTPVCFVVDEESSIRHFLSLVMQGSGVDTEEFADGAALREGLNRRTPDLVFLNVPLDAGDAIASLAVLGQLKCTGAVQLMSNRGSAVLENVKSIGEKHALRMLPVLKKPFETAAVQTIVRELKIGLPPSVAARIGLDEALQNGWIEFWYQPKIDLRKKQLAGAEAFARARHPEFGVLAPKAFMPGADDANTLSLSELAIVSALKAGQKFEKIGVNLRISVNIPVSALVKLDVIELVRAHRSNRDRWAGLIIDVTEEQIITDIALATEVARKLASVNVKLAIDDFGRGYSSLVRLKELPFAEMKLDRTFVADCGTDKVNAPICKTVIDLAHNFGSAAVAIGIEKASDVLALVSMGCDYGQGFLLGQPMPEERFISLLRQRATTRRAPAQAQAASA